MPSLLKKAQGIAAARMKGLVTAATGQMTTQLDAEIERLEDLARINNHVRPEEAGKLRESKEELLKAIAGAELRLDMIRLVLKTK